MNSKPPMREAFVACVVVLATITARAAQPIPAGEKAVTEVQVADRIYELNRRQYIAIHDKHGHFDPKWDEAAEQMLNVICRWRVPSTAPATEGLMPSVEQANAISNKLLASGCDDPLLMAFCGRLMCDAGNLNEGRDVLKKWRARLPETHYPLIAQAFPLQTLRVIALREGPRKADLARQYTNELIPLLIRVMQSDFYGPDDQQLLWRTLSHYFIKGAGYEFYQQLSDAVGRAKGIDPWLSCTLRGNFAIEDAWKARGNGYANTVSPAQWRAFSERIEVAAKLLNDAYNLHRDRPEPATGMITLAMAGHIDEGSARDWFDRAVAAQLDYLPAYTVFSHAIWPRWGGSISQMIAFGLECANTDRFDTEVPYQMFEIYQNVVVELDGSHELAGKLTAMYAPLDHVLAGYQEYDKEDLPRVAWNQSRRAALAWRFGRYDAARKMIEAAGDQLDASAWDLFGGDGATAIGESLARSGDLADATNAALDDAEGRRWAEASAAFSKLAATADLAPPVKDYLTLQARRADLMVRFEHGLVVDIQPNVARDWKTVQGTWWFDPLGGVRAKSTGRGMWMIHELTFGNRFEMTGVFEYKGASKHPGFFVGPFLNPTSGHSILFQADLIEQRVYVSRPSSIEKQSAAAPVREVNTFRLTCYDGAVTYAVNGQRAFSDPELLDPRADPPRIGLGANFNHPTAQICYRDVKIHKLDQPPGQEPPLPKRPEGLVLHYDFSKAPELEAVAPNATGDLYPARIFDPHWVKDGPAQALEFVGGDNYVDTGFCDHLPYWTISAIVRSPQPPGKGTATGPIEKESNFVMHWDHFNADLAGSVQVRNGGQWFVAKFGALKADTWYHLVGAYDGKVVRAYVNGVQTGAAETTGGPADDNQYSLKLARHVVWDAPFKGRLREVRVYDHALSADDVKKLYDEAAAKHLLETDK
ncbi:MAG: hypothetical protein GC159_18830 [Phycisphaera sp.]|nr:hypothetical protein [Phycisphaera sp.]